VCRQLIQLREILLGRVEISQVRRMTHPERIRCHVHLLLRWQLAFLLLFLENGW
jgi:hypothetical protein